MKEILNNILSYTRKRVFTYAIDGYPGKDRNAGVDDIVGPDLARELAVFVVKEQGEPNNRTLVVDTDSEVSSDRIIEIFRRHGVSARLLHEEEK